LPSSSPPSPPPILEITIPEVDSTTLSAAVHYAYTGVVALDSSSKEAALPLLAGLQLLGMNGAQAAVEEWVVQHLDASCALRVRHMAAHYHLSNLSAKAEDFVDRHFEAVVGHDDWLALPVEQVEQVLCRDQLRPSGEINVFRALVRWQRGAEGRIEVEDWVEDTPGITGGRGGGRGGGGWRWVWRGEGGWGGGWAGGRYGL
jgi:hypothetical protein